MKSEKEWDQINIMGIDHTVATQAAQPATMDRRVTEIAHDINQPLTAIANYSAACLRALQDDQPVSKVIGWLEQINAQAKRASQIVQQLHAFSRNEKIPPAVVDIDPPAREVADCTAIFEPFVTSGCDSLGMGLAICRSVVEARGGTLTVTSTPGQGTTFTFNLPMTDEDERA